MPTAVSRPPRYCRQREKNRPDRAYAKINGQRISLGNYGTPESYEKYSRLVNGQWKPAKKSAAVPPPTAPTMAVLMAEYLRFAINKYGGERTSEVVHTKQAFKLLRRTHGELLAREFGPKAFQQLRLTMIQAGWTRRYIRDQCQRIKRLIGWGVAEELLPRDAKHALDAVAGLAIGEFGVCEGHQVLPVPDDVVEATLAQLRPKVADMVRIQLLTSMRPGELVQLSAKYVDRSGDAWLFTPPKHKTQKRGKSRVIPIGPQAQQLLSKYLFSDRCFQYTSASYRRAVHRACDRAFPHPLLSAIPKRKLTVEQSTELETWQSDHRWSPNRLRHSAATMIREKFGLEHAQVALGHSRASTTEIYAAANQAKAIEVVMQVG